MVALFSILLFAMSITSNVLGGVSIAAWCEGCDNDAKRRRGQLVVGAPMMVAPGMMHHQQMYAAHPHPGMHPAMVQEGAHPGMHPGMYQQQPAAQPVSYQQAAY